MHINAIRMGFSNIYFKGSQVRISKLCCISFPENCFDLGRKAFHLGLNCFPNYPFKGSHNTKGLTKDTAVLMKFYPGSHKRHIVLIWWTLVPNKQRMWN